MTSSALLEQILRLPPDERLRLVEQIWDSLAAEADPTPMPAWHREELDGRLADATERATLSWQQVRARLSKRET
jgi:putative addiction module component (TIGR02574 family)